MTRTLLLLPFVLFTATACAETHLEELNIKVGRFDTGKHNGITDVKGVRVGHKTLVKGNGKLTPGKGPVRTGVTVILPSKDDLWTHKYQAGSFVLNGNGEGMGLMWIRESGILETPIALTNTLSVGNVQKGLIQYMLDNHKKIGITDDTVTPVVFECDDSGLNDIRGMHVKPKHVLEAIESASGGEVDEGAVGAGTGMVTFDFKAGIGTSSRVLPKKLGGYTVGVLLNANTGNRRNFRFLNVPLGQLVPDRMPKWHQEGSIVIVVATDAPLSPRQLNRVAKRATMGLARTGVTANHGSGDVAVAFSTANRIPHYPKKKTFALTQLSDFYIDPIFEAAADATEEAILNSLLAAETVTGRDNNRVYALPKGKIRKLLSRFGLGG